MLEIDPLGVIDAVSTPEDNPVDDIADAVA